MRNIDYRALYEQVQKNQDAVDPKKRRGTYDNLTHDERTQKAIDGNLARTMSVKLRDKGMGTGKKGVSPVEPANLKVVDEELETIKGVLIDHIADMSNDELWDLMALLDEQITAGKSYGHPSGLDLRTPQQKMNNIKGSVKQNDKIQGRIQPPPGA